MKRLGFIFGLSFYLSLPADGAKTFVDEGMQYHQAKEYNKAIELYKKALDQPIKSIDRDIIQYNLASSYLENNQFDLAINKFKEVIENKERLPGYIYERACYNLILAHLKKVGSFVEQEWPIEGKLQAEQIKKHLNNAHLYYQFLIDYKNKDQTVADGQWVEKIRQAIKELSSKLDEKIQQQDLKNLTFIVGLKSLEESLKEELICLETVLEKQFDSGFSKYFLEKTFAKEKEKLPIWQRIDQLYIEALDKDENQEKKNNETLKDEKESFLESYHHFLSALDMLKEGDAYQSHLLLHLSLLETNLLLAQIQKEDVIDYGLTLREKKAEQLDHPIKVVAMQTLLQTEYEQLCKLVSESIGKWGKSLQIEEYSNNKLWPFVAKELVKNLSNTNEHSSHICFCDHFLYQSYRKKLAELIMPLYSKLETDEKKLDSYEIDRLQVIGQLLKYHQAVEEEEQDRLLLQEQLMSLMQVKNSLENQQFIEAYQQLEHLLVNYHFSLFITQKLSELTYDFSFLADEDSIKQQHLDTLNCKFEKVLQLEEKIKDPIQKAANFNEIKKGLIKSQENFSFITFKNNQEVIDRLLMENSLAVVNRLIYDLSILDLSEIQRLWQGLSDQKHALKLATTYQNLDQPLAQVEEHLLLLARAAESYPLDDVKGLGAIIELKIMEAKENKAGLQNMLSHFKKGELAALKAKQLLANSCIVWDEVTALENEVIEHWTKALESFKQPPSQSSDQSPQQDQSQDGNSSSELVNQESSLASKESEMKETDEDIDKKNQALLQLLEQLNEMQQDDQVVKPQNKTLKKGLRPW